MDENIGKNLSKILSGKYSQKLLDHAKQSMTGAFKTDQNERLKKKTAEAICDLIGNKVANTITKVSKIQK